MHYKWNLTYPTKNFLSKHVEPICSPLCAVMKNSTREAAEAKTDGLFNQRDGRLLCRIMRNHYVMRAKSGVNNGNNILSPSSRRHVTDIT